jgi:hypothetical protein
MQILGGKTQENGEVSSQKCDYLGQMIFSQKKRKDIVLCTYPRITYQKIMKIVRPVFEKSVVYTGKKKTTKSEKTVFFDFLGEVKVLHHSVI